MSGGWKTNADDHAVGAESTSGGRAGRALSREPTPRHPGVGRFMSDETYAVHHVADMAVAAMTLDATRIFWSAALFSARVTVTTPGDLTNPGVVSGAYLGLFARRLIFGSAAPLAREAHARMRSSGSSRSRLDVVPGSASSLRPLGHQERSGSCAESEPGNLGRNGCRHLGRMQFAQRAGNGRNLDGRVRWMIAAQGMRQEAE